MTDSALTGHSGAVASLAVTAPPPKPLAPQAVALLPPRFDAVYDEHFDLVWRSLRRLGVPPESLDDAAQEVFLVVHRRLSEFKGRSSLKTWVVGISVRVASDFRRRQRRKEPASEPLGEELLDQRPGPDELAAQSEALRLLDATLRELDDEKREVFVLAELEHLSAPEISLALDLNVNTVYSRLRAARRLFEEALERRTGGER